MDNGFFGKLFDLDNSGKLEGTEQFLDFMAFCELTEKEEKKKDE